MTTINATRIISTRPNRAPGSIVGRLPVVLELERNGLVELAQPDDHPLELVLALARHANGIALDARLDLRELVADELRESLGEGVVEAAPELDHLAHLVAAGGLDLAPVEDLQRQVAPDRLRRDQVLDRRGAAFVVGQQRQLVLGLLEIDGHALEVIALL